MVVENQADTRKERRIATRRAQIIEAAATLFAEKGFHRTTTRDIAQAADVSEGTLYNYFESKDDMLIGIMEMLSDLSIPIDRSDPGLTEDARDFLVSVMSQRRDVIDHHNAMLQAVLSEILVNPELRQRYYDQLVVPAMDMISQHLSMRQQEGQIHPISVQYATRIIMALMLGLYVLEVLGDPMIQPEWDGLSRAVASLMYEDVVPPGAA